MDSIESPVNFCLILVIFSGALNLFLHFLQIVSKRKQAMTEPKAMPVYQKIFALLAT